MRERTGRPDDWLFVCLRSGKTLCAAEPSQADSHRRKARKPEEAGIPAFASTQFGDLPASSWSASLGNQGAARPRLCGDHDDLRPFQPGAYQDAVPDVRSLLPLNRDRGSSDLLSPPTPPDMRVRIRRFEKLRYTLCSLTEGAGVGLHHCPEQTRLHRALSGPFRQCGHLMPFPTHRHRENHSSSFSPSLTLRQATTASADFSLRFDTVVLSGIRRDLPR